jgi:hypothetical protein
MGEVEGGWGDEDLGRGGVGDGDEGLFMVQGIGVELHSLSTPIHKGQVARGVRVSRCGFNFCNIR